MKVLVATEQQKQELEGYYNGNGLKFIEDADGEWIIGESAIEYPAFAEIKEKLQVLPKKEYKPKKVNI